MNTATASVAQLTWRAVLLGVILAVLMAAANAYLGLFAGMTIASAIPSAVVSMAVLRLLGGQGSILEHNIVQTGGSAGSSTATGAIFVLPALVMLGHWQHYPYLWVVAFVAMGGVLGVLFSVPLRRALIIDQKLAFPEGTAAAEVLRAGDDPKQGAKLLALAGAGGAALKLAGANGLRLIPDAAAAAGFAGKSLLYVGMSLSAAMLGVGYVCGLNVGIVIVSGSLISWNIALPIYSHYVASDPTASGVDAAYALWSQHLRYLGVGAMLVGGVWTLIALRGSIINSVRMALKATSGAAAAALDERERDLPMRWVLAGIAACVLPLLFMYHSVVGSFGISIVMAIMMIALSFLFCAVSAYMTGLVGGSNDPVSGMIIATVLSAAALLLGLTGGDATIGPVAAIMVGAAVCCAVCLASDNLQDLKCGYLIGASPWRQQLMLGVGAVTSALVLAPVLNLLASAYGIGVADALHPKPLLAPQATLMATVAKGLFGGNLQWDLITYGALIGVAVIVLDVLLKKRGSNFRTPVLAVAVGIYLPLDVTSPIFLGGLLAHYTERARKGLADEPGRARRGTLYAAGMIAGESLMGVLIAIPIVATGRADVLSLPDALQFAGLKGSLLGMILLAGLAWALYRAGTRAAR
jgi:putative OPT family oligopeptide transporter